MSNVEQLPIKATSERPAPRRIVRPCEWGLLGAVRDMETQMGTVEAYNRLCDAAQQLKAKIDRGEAQAQNKLFATDPKWIYPAG
ncbi:hypothetical protein LFL96_20915 [Paraburkholderia sp. D15]|uniref:hypothetical protein n=1 Tax=Paraburkholderia sp. D15 TaxID=2880218 RepID=UPI00247A788B|nr:hypothetical protein [Paraburkholderia sp. D15]WGS53523.1 hypothetical protein LFL96_20915 [Paraburkholderia sp. D15]